MTTTTSTPAKPQRVTENDDFVAMMQRMIRALEVRAVNDPALLAQVMVLVQQLSEVTDVVIAKSAAAYQRDARLSPSMSECAAILGFSKQAASVRRAKGEAIIAKRLAAHGVASLAAAKVERKARQRAAEHAAAAAPVYTRTRTLRAV